LMFRTIPYVTVNERPELRPRRKAANCLAGLSRRGSAPRSAKSDAWRLPAGLVRLHHASLSVNPAPCLFRGRPPPWWR